MNVRHSEAVDQREENTIIKSQLFDLSISRAFCFIVTVVYAASHAAAYKPPKTYVDSMVDIDKGNRPTHKNVTFRLSNEMIL